MVIAVLALGMVVGGILGGGCGLFGAVAYVKLFPPFPPGQSDGIGEGLFILESAAVGTAVGSLAGAVLGMWWAAERNRRLGDNR